MEVVTNGRKDRYSGWAITIVLMSLVFVMPFALVFGGDIIPSFDQNYIFLIGCILALIVWLLGRLTDGVITIPMSPVVYASGALLLAYFLSAIFSYSRGVSFYGQISDTETFWSFALLIIAMLLASLAFQSIKKVSLVPLFIIGSATIATIIKIVNLVIGNSSNYPIPESGLFYGLVLLLSLVIIEFAPPSSFLRYFSIFGFAMSLFGLIIANEGLAWMLVIIFASIIAVVKLKSRLDKRAKYAISAICIALICLFLGSSGRPLDRLLTGVAPSTVVARPSWGSTIRVAKASLRDNPIFGIGPNLFARQWVKYKGVEVNTGPFWFVDFNYGVGIIPTSLVTTGIVGFISWLVFLALIFVYTLASVVRYTRSQTGAEPLYSMLFWLLSGYLWLASFVSVPDFWVLAFAFIFTGIAVALMVVGGTGFNTVIATRIYPRGRVLSIFIFTVLLIGSVSVMYMFVTKHRAVLAFERGVESARTGDLDQTLSHMLQATGLDNMDIYHRAVSGVYLSMLLRSVNAPGQEQSPEEIRNKFIDLFGRTVSEAQLAINADQTNYLNWVLIGNIYESVVSLDIEGASEHTTSSYHKAEELNPTSPLIPFQLARLASIEKDIETMVKHLNKTLSLKPNYAPAYMLASQTAHSGGDIETALKTSEMGVIAAPNDFEVFSQLGYLRYQNGDFALSILALERSIALNPHFADSRYFLGLAYAQMGRIAEAITQLEILSKDNPDDEQITNIIEELRRAQSLNAQ